MGITLARDAIIFRTMDEANQYKIFIVDDDTFLLNMYVAKFKKAGHDVETAKSGTDALKRLQDGFKPNVMLLDMVLPGMDGLELLKEIRKENLAPDTMFIMFTNQSGGEEIEAAKKLGVTDYIIKAELVPSGIVDKVLKIIENNRS